MAMTNDKVLLMAQLVDSISQTSKNIEEAYAKNDKKKFELAKEALLDFQGKLVFLLRTK